MQYWRKNSSLFCFLSLFILVVFFFFSSFFFETLPLSKKANVYYRVKTAYDSHTLTKKDQTDGGVI